MTLLTFIAVLVSAVAGFVAGYQCSKVFRECGEMLDVDSSELERYAMHNNELKRQFEVSEARKNAALKLISEVDEMLMGVSVSVRHIDNTIEIARSKIDQNTL